MPGRGMRADFPFEHAPGFALRIAEQRRQALWQEEVGGLLSPPQYTVIATLHPHPLEQYELGAAARVDKATLTPLIGRLARDGIVEVAELAHDRRRRRIALSPRGEALLERVRPAVVRVNDRLLAPLDAAERIRAVLLWRRVADLTTTIPDPQEGDLADLSPGFALRVARQRYQQLWRAEVGDLLTPTQYRLGVVLETHGELPLGAVARLGAMPMSDAVRVARRLEDAGLVLVRSDEDDLRRRLASLTGVGSRTVGAARALALPAQLRLMQGLDDEARAELIRSTLRVAERATPDFELPDALRAASTTSSALD